MRHFILRLDFLAVIFHRIFHDCVIFFHSDQHLSAHEAEDVFRRIAFGLPDFHGEHVQGQDGTFWDFHFSHHRLAQLWTQEDQCQILSNSCTLHIPVTGPSQPGLPHHNAQSSPSQKQRHSLCQVTPQTRAFSVTQHKGKGSGCVARSNRVQHLLAWVLCLASPLKVLAPYQSINRVR